MPCSSELELCAMRSYSTKIQNLKNRHIAESIGISHSQKNIFSAFVKATKATVQQKYRQMWSYLSQNSKIKLKVGDYLRVKIDFRNRISPRKQRRRDICGRTTSIWQFSSEMQQTWHIYYPRPREQLLLQRFFYKFRPWTAPFRWISPIFLIF
jgi:hypothetical protein